jgi:putative acetyltransferase
MTTSGPHLRPATAQDAQAVALVHRAAFGQALWWIPRLHTPEEDLAFFTWVVNEQQALVVESGGAVVGFSAYDVGWLNQLYVAPDHQNLGIGGRLLGEVKLAHQGHYPAQQLSLWTFQANAGARRFYERHQFVPVEFTDGSGNEEREPDVRYEWRATA